MLKKFLLGIFILFALGIAYLWYVGLLQYIPFLFWESFHPSPAPVIKDETPVPKKILAHQTSLGSLGIEFQTVDGNAADILVPLIGDPNKTGTWYIKYKDKKEEEIFLDEEDRKILYDIATRNRLSFHPEHYAMGPSPLDMPDTILPSMHTIRMISRIASSTAILLENQGQRAEAEKLLRTVLVLGRQMQESLSATEIQWLVGIAVETVAAENLMHLYLNTGDQTKAVQFEGYVKEIKDLKNVNSFEFEKLTKISLATALVSGLAYEKKDVRPAVRLAYLKFATTEGEFLNLLDSAKNYDDVPLQGDLLLPLTFLRASDGLEMESKVAERVLKVYAESKNPFIANLAKAGLSVTPTEFQEWFAKTYKK